MTAQQLKNSILQMAVQGKLVPQDPNDEPASVLLERIRAEKEQMIKEGKIKKEKNPSYIFRGTDNLPYEKIGDNDPVCIADEVPFDIPDSWEWVRLGNVFNIEMGQSPASSSVHDYEYGIEFHQGKVFFGNRILKRSNQKTTAPTKYAEPNSVLLCVRAPVGKVNITDRRICIGRGLCSISPLGEMDINFVFHLLETYENEFVKKATGTTFISITSEIVKQQIIPIPPLTEQQRIVEKVERLLPYIDKYGKAESNVNILNTEFPEQLKKSILQQAIQGKLVHQDATDEPASVLLERIRAEKENLIKEGKTKRDKHESVIFRRDNSHYELLDGVERCIDDEIPFDIPDSWEWARAQTLGIITRGSGIKRNETISNGFPCVRYGELYTTYTTSFKSAISAIPQNLYNKCKRCSYGDILMTLTGENKPDIAKSVAYLGNENVAVGGDLAFWTNHGMNSLFLTYVMSAPYAINKKVELATGDIIVHISCEKIGSILIPIPPLIEQQRIVSKLEILLSKIKAL